MKLGETRRPIGATLSVSQYLPNGWVMEEHPGSTHELVLEVAGMIRATMESTDISVGGALDGLELDIVVKTGRGRGRRVLVVECKAYSRLVGIQTVTAFGSMFEYLRQAEDAHEGWIVTSSGFTSGAVDVARRYGIELFTMTDLRQKLGVGDRVFRPSLAELQRITSPAHGKKRIFVIMPFESAMDDVYILGIRWVAAKLGLVAQRADDLQHYGGIVAEIQKAIRDYDAVVGDTSGANPNVCYEVGFAHALDRPTVLICRRGHDLPFDLRGVNHLMYPNVLALRAQLLTRLRAVLGM
jgi:hypothetical protein